MRRPDSDYKINQTRGVNFEIDYIEIEGHFHRVSYAGNKNGIPVIIMMGVFEDSLNDSRWLVANMVNHPQGKSFQFITITVPFLEEYTEIKLVDSDKAKYDGLIPPNKKIKMKNSLSVDKRFDLENCAHTLRKILKQMKIKKAHFVGHDRGCIIMDNLLAEFPEMAISYSRGSQGWTNFNEEWLNLVDKGIFLGPPHRIMATRAFPSLLKSAIMGGAPFGFIAPSFSMDRFTNSNDDELNDRWNAIQQMPNQSQHFFKLTRQIFRQTDFVDEGKRRSDRSRGFCILDTNFPMMQFQGSDEMLLAKDLPNAKKISIIKRILGVLGFAKVKGIFKFFRLRFPTYVFADLPDDYGIISNHLGDQPYFGKYNFWVDEVMDLLPGATYQDRKNPTWKKNYKKYVTIKESGRYSELKLKKGSRFSRFVIISDALHWTHIERPENVAYACMDFIKDNNN